MVRQPEQSGRGLLAVLGATAVAGLSGYLIQLLAARLLPDPFDYLSFSVFWSTMYLVGAAVGGVQQEVARATAPGRREARSGGPLTDFTIVASAAVLVVALIVGMSVAPAAFAGTSGGMAGALALGLTGYLATSVLTGVLYGLHRLGSVSLLIIIDAVLRAAAVVLALAAGAPPDLVAYAVATPFGLAVLVVWLGVRRRVSYAFVLDVTPRRLARNTLHTISAAAATGIMVTGMPLLLRLTLPDASVAAVAALTLVLTLTRAPFIIPLMALQSFLTVSYRDDPEHAHRRSLRYLAIAFVAAVIAAALSWLLVPGIIDLISEGRYEVSPATAALVVVSAILVGSLCVSGPLLLARAHHRAYAAGWLAAAVSTILLLIGLPMAATARALTAIVAAPAVGLIVHLVAMQRLERSGRQSSASQSE